MLRLLFPEISFQGRLGRGAFCRELLIAAATTPIVVGLLTYLADGVTFAAMESGSDEVRGKFIAGLMLTALWARNSMAMLGVIRRRMNDLGYGRQDFWRDSRPIQIAILLLVVFAATAPTGVTAMLIVPIFWIFIWQFVRLIGLCVKLFSAPSGSEAVTTRVSDPNPWGEYGSEPQQTSINGVKGQPLKQVTDAIDHLKGAFDEEFKSLSKEEQAKRVRAELKVAAEKIPFLAMLLNVRQWLDQPVVAKGDTSESYEAPQRSREPRAQRRGARRKKEIFKSPTGSAVQVASSLPKPGRSSLLSGLLRGPWG